MFKCHCAIIVSYCIFILVFLLNATTLNEKKPKTVLVVLLVRNKQHTLPYFLTTFSKLNYPKNRISLFIRSDHNIDRSSELLEEWLAYHGKNFHSVDVLLNDDSPESYQEGSPTNWTESRFDHIMALKNEALSKARLMWTDYIWFIDVDVFIVDPDILSHLISEEKAIVAPMLFSLGTYSNFWCGMTDNYWYQRTDDYLPILNRKNIGCFSVPMVHSCVLIDLNLVASDALSYDTKSIPNYDGPKDDIIIFAMVAKQALMEMFICNNHKYGYIPTPVNEYEKLSKDYQYLIDIKLEALVDFPPFHISTELHKYAIPLPQKAKLGFDNIYLINLVRRPDRREKMMRSFDELGISVEIFEAIDGKRMNASHLENIGVKQLPVYKDPWSKRDMTYGEIGCFLSHFFIWEDIVNKQYEQVIVFEDDIRFQPFFINKVKYMMNQVKAIKLDWDLVYLGRKILQNSDEPWVEGSDILVHADYSYWTLCYMINLRGAKKLLSPHPLGKMVPVDEYIPIMFDRHPEKDWLTEYSPRDLKAFSASPLMVFPTHYTGEDGYISDTEASSVIEEEFRTLDQKPVGPPPFQSRGHDLEVEFKALGKEEL